tara:strand:+ start:244 stop:663 length:420 start_codon:yes stop_codon:yes gene_type:complete
MGLTKVGQGVIQDNLDLGFGDIQANTIVASAGIKGIGIHSAGQTVHDGIIETINFVGAGNTFLVDGGRVDISIAGGSGGASEVYDSTVFAYKNVIDSNIRIELPHKTALIYADPEVTVDIEPNVTLTVDDGVFFSIVDV